MRRMVILSAFLVLSLTASAFAGDINPGDRLTWVYSPYHPGGDYHGGPFVITDTTTGTVFEAFCLEVDEGLDNPMYVQDVSKTAFEGGIDLDDQATPGDPVSLATQILAYSWFENIHGPKSTDLAKQMQEAIWILEDELTSSSVPGVAALVAWAEDAGNQELYGEMAMATVMVVNPLERDRQTPAQSMIFKVPEPASISLLGLGIFGIALAMRRKRS